MIIFKLLMVILGGGILSSYFFPNAFWYYLNFLHQSVLQILKTKPKFRS